MIVKETAGNIGDPMEFVAANQRLRDHGPYFICGADKSMLVRYHTRSHPPETHEEHQDSDVLGSLYRYGNTYGWAGDTPVGIEWYPSAPYVNTLSEQLGRRPGEDILRFTYDSYPYEIPILKYTKQYLANGDFPQALNFFEFGHDRGPAHAIGVLLLPPQATRNVIKESAALPSSKRTTRRAERVAGHFDRTTTDYRRYLVAPIWERMMAGAQDPQNIDISPFTRIHTAYWDIPGPGSRKKYQQIVEMTVEHLTDLSRKVTALQAAA